MGSLRSKKPPTTHDESLGPAWETLPKSHSATISKSSSAATLTDTNGFSQSTVSSRPPMRARGMTDSGTNLRSGFFTDIVPPNNSQTSQPRVIIRQPSVARIGMPPSAPPKHQLPPPPSRGNSLQRLPSEAISATNSSPSPSLSFASSSSSNRDMSSNQRYSPRQKEKKPSERLTFYQEIDDSRSLQPSSSTSRSLKKALSHQSLGRRSQSSNNPIPSLLPEPLPEMIPRKQRSFHQPKLIIPTLPLSIRHTNTGANPSPSSDSSLLEQRRGSAGLIVAPCRKRLFSGPSNRPSTSQSVMSDDDDRSLFSIRSDSNQTTGSSFFKPWAQSLSPTTISPTSVPSFWDDPPPLSPSHREYIPQQILSPDEMARLDASEEESNVPTRTRVISILSASTMMSSEGEAESVSSDHPTSESVTWDNRASDGPPGRRNSLLSRGLPTSRLPLRPSTSQATMTTSPISHSHLSNSSSSTSHTMTSLPPPPRRPQLKTTFVIAQQTDEPYSIMSLPPPPRKVDKGIHRPSIMRKPSFLEIDDESEDADTDVEEIMGGPIGGSFLDLARESFDTGRGGNE